MSNANVVTIPAKNNLVSKFAKRFGVDEDKVVQILRSTAFKVRDGSASDEQVTALMIVAEQYGLNPWTKEIYAYPDKSNGIVPVVGVDGWSRIINEHPQMDGIEFNYSPETIEHKGKVAHEWIECVIYRKDRSKPVVVREYLDEVMRSTSYVTPWDTHPKRMHRHKAEIQCARIAFGFAGIYDEDEAERIIEKDVTPEGSHEVATPPNKDYLTDSEFNSHTPTWKAKWLKGVPKGLTIEPMKKWVADQTGKHLTDEMAKTVQGWVAEEPPTVIDGQATLIPEHQDFIDGMNAQEQSK